MVSKWEEGQMYIWLREGTTWVHVYFEPWRPFGKDIPLNKGEHVVLLKKDTSDVVLPDYEYAKKVIKARCKKVLHSSGEIFWIRLERPDWTPLSNRWMKQQRGT